AAGMVPGGAEGDPNAATRFQQGFHNLQDISRISKVLKRIERYDHLGLSIRLGAELTAVGNASMVGVLAGSGEDFRPDVDPDHPAPAALGELHSLMPFTATKIDDGLPLDIGPEPGPQQLVELAFALVGIAVHGRMAAVVDLAEQAVAEISAEEAHA